MNKTLWQVLIIGALAEIIMFCALIFAYGLSLSNIGSGYLYIFALMFCYLSILRIFKSYKAAFIPCGAAAAMPAFSFLYFTHIKAYLAAALFCGLSFFAYTFTAAKGLKHNQDKHFLILSLFLYVAALYFSAYSSAMLLLILIYEIRCEKIPEVNLPKKKIYFFLLTLFAVILKFTAF
jgi:hypothetical protein